MRHTTQEVLVRMGKSDIQADFQEQASMIRSAEKSDPSDAKLPTKIAILDNNIAKGYFDIANKIPIEMLESEKNVYEN